MTPQIIFGIFSLLLLILALFFILPPLFRKPTDVKDDRRDQNIRITKHQLAELETEYAEGRLDADIYRSTKEELEDALYDDLDDAEVTSTPAKAQSFSKLPALLVALLIPALAVGLYLKVGQPKAIPESSVVITQAGNPDKPKMSLEEMVLQLEKKLQAEPDNFTGWSMLGRSYMIINRPDDAVKAYQKALELKPDDATTLLQTADALGTSKSGVLTGKPEELILKALKIDPENLMGLWLAGMSAKQRGADSEAVAYWQKVLPKLHPNAPERKEVLGLIKSAGGSSVSTTRNPPTTRNPSTTENSPPTRNTPTTENTAKETAPNVAQTVSLTVDISSELKAKASPEQTVFIYAKAVSGPPMPLAAVRKQVKDLPFSVQLDDSMAMMAQLKLSAFPQVTVGARVSVSGTPTKSAGDLWAEQSPVELGESVSLTIDQVAK